MRFHVSVRSFKYLPVPSFSSVLRPFPSPTRLGPVKGARQSKIVFDLHILGLWEIVVRSSLLSA